MTNMRCHSITYFLPSTSFFFITSSASSFALLFVVSSFPLCTISPRMAAGQQLKQQCITKMQSRVSSLRSQVSGLLSQVSGLRSRVSGLSSHFLFCLFPSPFPLVFLFGTLHLINFSSTYIYIYIYIMYIYIYI